MDQETRVKRTQRELIRRMDFRMDSKVSKEDEESTLNWLEVCPREIWEHIFSFLRDADTDSLRAARHSGSHLSLAGFSVTRFLGKFSADDETSRVNQGPPQSAEKGPFVGEV